MIFNKNKKKKKLEKIIGVLLKLIGLTTIVVHLFIPKDISFTLAH